MYILKQRAVLDFERGYRWRHMMTDSIRDPSYFVCKYTKNSQTGTERGNSRNHDPGRTCLEHPTERKRRFFFFLKKSPAVAKQLKEITNEKGCIEVLRRDPSFFRQQFSINPNKGNIGEISLTTETRTHLEELEQNIGNNADERQHTWSRHRIYKMWNRWYNIYIYIYIYVLQAFAICYQVRNYKVPYLKSGRFHFTVGCYLLLSFSTKVLRLLY